MQVALGTHLIYQKIVPHCNVPSSLQAVCAEFLATFIFVFVVVSCVVFTHESRYIPAVIELVHRPSASPSPPQPPTAALLASAAALGGSSSAGGSGGAPTAPSPLSSGPPRWLLADAPTPPWIASLVEAARQVGAAASGARSLAASAAVQNPDITRVEIKVETLGMTRWFLIANALGFMIGALVFSVGSISGANINPAVTLALAVTGKLSWFRAFCYAFAQCLGSVLGALVVRSLAPNLYFVAGGGVNAVVAHPRIGVWTVLGGEMLGTAILVLVVCAAADVGREAKSKYQGALTPLMIGLAVVVGHLFLIPVDGCSLNPARSFGPALAMEDFTNHWVFWVGPCLGGVLAALAYTNLFVGFQCGGLGGGEEGGASGAKGASAGGGGTRAGAANGQPQALPRLGTAGTAAPSAASLPQRRERRGGGGDGDITSGGHSTEEEEEERLEEEDSLGSAGGAGTEVSSAAPTPQMGSAGEGPEINRRISLAQGNTGEEAPRGSLSRLGGNAQLYSGSGFGGAPTAERKGVRDW